MEEKEEDKKIPNEISTSINILNEKENEEKEKEKEDKEKEEEKGEKEIKENKEEIEEKKEEKEEEKEEDEKNEKITLEDLKNIISEPDEQEQDQELGQEESIDKKDSGNLSHDEILESEISIIKKKNLSKYLMVNNKFKSTNSESEEEIFINKFYDDKRK